LIESSFCDGMGRDVLGPVQDILDFGGTQSLAGPVRACRRPLPAATPARVASIFAFLAVVLPVLAGTSLRNGPLIRVLENCYPHPYWPPHVGGMLVLGSGFANAVRASTALVRTSLHAEPADNPTFSLHMYNVIGAPSAIIAASTMAPRA
jgi:hypothetical protein